MLLILGCGCGEYNYAKLVVFGGGETEFRAFIWMEGHKPPIVLLNLGLVGV
jgi:hypothetical protein